MTQQASWNTGRCHETPCLRTLQGAPPDRRTVVRRSPADSTMSSPNPGNLQNRWFILPGGRVPLHPHHPHSTIEDPSFVSHFTFHDPGRAAPGQQGRRGAGARYSPCRSLPCPGECRSIHTNRLHDRTSLIRFTFHDPARTLSFRPLRIPAILRIRGFHSPGGQVPLHPHHPRSTIEHPSFVSRFTFHDPGRAGDFLTA